MRRVSVPATEGAPEGAGLVSNSGVAGISMSARTLSWQSASPLITFAIAFVSGRCKPSFVAKANAAPAVGTPRIGN